MKTKIIHISKKGRALFAEKNISKGELVESCELIFVKNSEITRSIEAYVYQYDNKHVVIALGNGSLINHSDDPNCEFYFSFKKKLLIIRTIKNVSKGEELTINYGYSRELKKRFKLQN
jgi:uncharacterized protein